VSRIYLVRRGKAAFGTDREASRGRSAVRLKLIFCDTGVSCLLCDGETLTIASLNSIGHLERPALASLITHR
jgi:hypothetical protein